MTVIEETTEDKLPEREQWWMDKTKCYRRSEGFNISPLAGAPFHKGMGEKEAIRKLNQIIKRYKPSAKLPSRDSKNRKERSDALWIYAMKAAKAGKYSSLWYPILDEIALKAGMPDLFDSRETTAVKKLQRIISKYKTPENLPSARSSDPQEAADAVWLTKTRAAKLKKDDRTWYPELETIANTHGFLNLFDTQSPKDYAKEMFIKIVKRYESVEMIPKDHVAVGEDKKYVAWLRNMRANKKGTGNGVWYPELDQYAAENNFSGIFDSRRRISVMDLVEQSELPSRNEA